MPTLGQIVTPPKASAERVQATNKIKIKNGTRPAKIVDVWIFNVDQDGHYTKEATMEQKASIKVAFDARPDVVLEKRMRAYLSRKAKFALLIQSLTGIEAGSKEMMGIDPKQLVGTPCLVTTLYDDSSGYTNITDIVPAAPGDDDFGAPEPQSAPVAHHQSEAIGDGPITVELDDDELPF